MYEEQTIPMEQYNSLQALVGELLLTNQKLREKLGWQPRVPMSAAIERFLGQFDPVRV